MGHCQGFCMEYFNSIAETCASREKNTGSMMRRRTRMPTLMARNYCMSTVIKLY